MKSDFQEFLEDNATDCSYTVRAYSGRSMYGKECIGIDCEDAITTIAQLAFQAGQDDFTKFQDMIDSMRVDSMGRGSIVYWPREKYEAAKDVCAACSVELCGHCGQCHASDCPQGTEPTIQACIEEN
jgi:hypothetical protein